MDIREENTVTKLIAHIEGEIDLEKTEDFEKPTTKKAPK